MITIICKSPNLFIVAFLYAHVPNCYTQFNLHQPPRAHFSTRSSLVMPGKGHIGACPQSYTTFPILVIFLPVHLGLTTFFPFFIGYDHSHLQRLLFLVYTEVPKAHLWRYFFQHISII